VHLDLYGSRIWVSGSRSIPPFYGLHHFGLSTDNIEATVAELKSNGFKFMIDKRFGGDIVEPQPGVKAANFWAPENVVIELWSDPEDL
jgi:hypothetical protein